MTVSETRRVGERGQVTLPKELREAFGLEGGDEVRIREEEGKIVIDKAVTRERLAEGYRQRAERDHALAEELAGISQEANSSLGDAPETDSE
ncbi:AbrB/MazE/SpoVT family DNA-binding domain-containing protein [Saliphagus sp. LR7]|uniref:AbrB/MazE/SpoVT family DNA-binding domain-containing protein n=1 Tax=Saliphagus sp. LR7 TaxID=2282654 RepID=UPI000DF8313B|nr:AbrB/MazE/SpoVT family DNA-binding domain-containing protein [Saliphagus sp. LR7]